MLDSRRVDDVAWNRNSTWRIFVCFLFRLSLAAFLPHPFSLSLSVCLSLFRLSHAPHFDLHHRIAILRSTCRICITLLEIKAEANRDNTITSRLVPVTTTAVSTVSTTDSSHYHESTLPILPRLDYWPLRKSRSESTRTEWNGRWFWPNNNAIIPIWVLEIRSLIDDVGGTGKFH